MQARKLGVGGEGGNASRVLGERWSLLGQIISFYVLLKVFSGQNQIKNLLNYACILNK